MLPVCSALFDVFGIGLTDQWNVVYHAPTATICKFCGAIIDAIVVAEYGIVIDQAVIAIQNHHNGVGIF